MSPQNWRRGNCAKFIQLIQLVWAENFDQYTIFQYSLQARLSAHPDWISFMYRAWRNILVIHLAGSFIYNSIHPSMIALIWMCCEGKSDEFDDCDIRELRLPSREEMVQSPCVRAANITTREYTNKLLLLKQLDSLRDLLKKVGNISFDFSIAFPTVTLRIIRTT